MTRKKLMKLRKEKAFQKSLELKRLQAEFGASVGMMQKQGVYHLPVTTPKNSAPLSPAQANRCYT